MLQLPIRQLINEPDRAVASLLLNQAALPVAETLCSMLVDQLAGCPADAVLGLPTQGLPLAAGVARAMGHSRFVPTSYTRKFWYDQALSAPVRSTSTPAPGKRIYLDPHQLVLVHGKRVILVDDAISSGATLASAWDLLESLGAEVVACAVRMRQGRRWADRLGPGRNALLQHVLDSPLLQAVAGGWVARH